MSEFVSRVYVSTEAVVICLPVTVLFITARISTQIFHLLNVTVRDAAANLGAALLVLAIFACVWRLATAFVIDGRRGLRAVSAYWWVPPLVGAVLGLGLSVHLWFAQASAPSWAVELAWAIPFVVPLLHLAVERRLHYEADAAGRYPGGILDPEASGARRVEPADGASRFDTTITRTIASNAWHAERLVCDRIQSRPRDVGVPFA